MEHPDTGRGERGGVTATNQDRQVGNAGRPHRGAGWVAELNETESRFRTTGELRAFLAQTEALPSGRLFLGLDRGPLPWWKRFLGARSRDLLPCCSLEWYGEHAALIFHDEAWSEYRARDPEHPTGAGAGIRLKISHGEPVPVPDEECIRTARAFEAIRHFLDYGARPEWLSYRYVR